MKAHPEMELSHVTNLASLYENTSMDCKALQELGDSFLTLGDTTAARQCYEKAAQADVDACGPYVGLGTIALQSNLVEDAEIAFRVARRLDPSCCKAYEGLGVIALRKAEYENAFDLYLKCLELNSNNLNALLGLFQTSSQMGSFVKIIHYLEVYLGMHPEDTAVMFSLATLYLKENQFDKSRHLLLRVLALSSDNKDAEDLLEEIEHHLARYRL
jgi:tetratricopeptide (TPR) repeat protein